MAEKIINKQQVRQHFSLHAREYDRYAKVQQVVARRLALLLKEYQRPFGRALEVGCGTGMLSRQLLDLQPDMDLILSDIAHGMCQQVQENYPHQSVCALDAAALPFVEETFDLVTSSSVYQWLNDLPNAFAEIFRVLRPGGVLAIAFFGEKTLYELRNSHQAVLLGKQSHVQSFPEINAVADALVREFQVLNLHAEFEIEWHENVSALLRALKKIGAQNASQKRPPGLASRQVMQQMMTHYNDVYGCEDGIPATYEVIYLLARKG